MVGILLLLLLLALLFGGLGVFVAKAFLFGLILVLLVGLIAGRGAFRGGRV